MTILEAPLTNLEATVLGVVARDGPVTSYAVTREFSQSPSAFWSGSAGAIYPLMQRLRARGSLAGKPGKTGKRRCTFYQITLRGRAELECWLLDADLAADMGFDPLRTRLAFLSLVSPTRRRTFLNAVAEKTASLRASATFEGAAEEHNKDWLNMRLGWLKRLARRPRSDEPGPDRRVKEKAEFC